MDGLAVADLKTVVAPLNFLTPMAEKPVAYNYEPPPGVPARTGKSEGGVEGPVSLRRLCAAKSAVDLTLRHDSQLLLHSVQPGNFRLRIRVNIGPGLRATADLACTTATVVDLFERQDSPQPVLAG
jgi:hypothetical protein